MTAKKPPKKSTAKRRDSSLRESVSVLKKTIGAQEKTIAAQAQEIREALEQQTATSEILRVIASSPTDIKPVLDAIVESAARVCEADDAIVWRVDGNVRRLATHFGPIPIGPVRRDGDVIDRATPVGRAVLDQQTIHVHDLQAAEADFPLSKSRGIAAGLRTVLATPLLQKGIAIGAILIRRREVRPFSERQIILLETFADQAVIAIENVRLFQELKEALEQQTATSEILGVIASSPTEIQPVLDAIAENAARICNANDATIRLAESDVLRLAAHRGPIAVFAATELPIDRDWVTGRSLLDRQPIHIEDVQSVAAAEFPRTRATTEQEGTRTVLVVPLVREDTAIGTILIRRTEVRPFSDKQIALLKTFADQAVIAIENVRLFRELGERNAELREALEHQTATAEVLSIISRSPTDVQPVLDAIVESAARVCGIDDVLLRLREGNTLVPRAHFGSIPIGRLPSTDEPHSRWMREHGALHIPDIRAQNDFPMMGSTGNYRTYLAAPLCQQGELIGRLIARRTEVHPFTPAQIKLMETFADQAVIAIENVRLFQELKESLEQQTATSEILGVIASSPTDIQPVLDAVAASAARLCDSVDAQIFRVEGDVLRIAASYGALPKTTPEETRPVNRGSVNGRAVVDRRTIHVHDLAAESETEWPEGVAFQRRFGHRTILATPLLREGTPIGAINIRRWEVRPFSDKQIKLLETFADQAVIAIENVRLFKELQARNRDLTEALEQQTATSEILGVIASSPNDLTPVLETVAQNAARLCEAKSAQVFRIDGDVLRFSCKLR